VMGAGSRYFFLLLLFFPVIVCSQDKNIFDFSGSSKLESRISSSRNAIHSVPTDYLRWGANTAIKAWGLPIRASWLISTENESFRQSLNQFKISVNYQEFLKSSILEKAPWLKFIRRLDIGKSFPSYSKLCLSGVALEGINAELNPGLLYAAFAYGKIRRSIYEDGYPATPFRRKLKYYRAGVGDRLSSHIHFGYLKVWDEVVNLPDSLQWEAPSGNNVVSTDLALYFLKRKIYFKGEGAVSLFTQNTQATMYTDEELPEIVVNQFSPNLTSSIDYAYFFESGLNLKTTRIKAFYKIINPGFRSLGVGVLRNDVSEYGAQISQSVYKRHITLTAKLKRNIDNLLGIKSYQSTDWHYGFGMNIRFPKMPFLMLNYSPHEQYRETPISRKLYVVRVLNTRSSYSYINGGTSLTTSLGYTRQSTLSGEDELELGRLSNILSLSESLRLKKKWLFSLSTSWNRMLIDENLRNLLSASFNARYEVNKRINTFAGFQRFQSLNKDSRNRLQLGGNWKLEKWGDISITAERFSGPVKDSPGGKYSDMILRMSWMVSF